MKKEKYELNGKEIIIPIPECYKDCMLLIKSDRYRHSGKMESSISIIIRNLKPYSFSLPFWLRLSQYKGWMWPLCRWRYLRACRQANIILSPSTKIGYGLLIGHASPIVVNGKTIIGNNVNISQFLSIGTNHQTPAIIGDNVYIGPNVCIVEDVKIGNNSSMGAGAIVNKDVPENATVAGAPAKVLSFDNPGRFVHRRFPIE